MLDGSSTSPLRRNGRATLGIVGGGQLARMSSLAAAGLGVPVAVLAEDPQAPALATGAHHVAGSERSLDGLRRLAAASDVVTFDHEGVPPDVLRELEREGAVLRPRPAAKLMAQDKAEQREALGGRVGVPVPAWRIVATPDDVERFGAEHGWPVVLKISRGGYDGRGVWFAATAADADEPLEAAARTGARLLAEQHLDLDCELAVLVARADGGAHVVYPVVHTVQRDGMCREMAVPAPVPEDLARAAQETGASIADAIEAVGIVAVELFVADGRVLVNELALRPHNSGHWSLGGAVTSQFENHVRAVLGWPLGDPSPLAPAVACANVVGAADGGDPRERLADALAVPGALVQLYGKQPRPGRKLGHVTALGDDAADARERARRAAAILEGGES